MGRDSAVGIVTRCGPGRGEIFFSLLQTDPGAHPAFYTMAIGSFPGVKWREPGVDHLPQSRAEVKERVETTPLSPPGLRGRLCSEI